MDGQIVVVTGATGFVGSHVIKQLLEQGYTVRGTVRDAKDAKKCDFLQKLVVPAGTDPSRFTLFSADLTAPGSYDEVLRGATSLIHTAAVVKFTADDPQREIIDVTVNGVKNVISSLEKVLPDGKLKHVVMTSSIAAIQDLQRPEGHVYTEEDFNVSATVADDPYSVSKYQSEKIMTEWVKSQQDKGVDVTVAFINPGAIYGPIYSAAHILGSSTIIHDMMSGKFPAAPHLGFPSVDVRDVALAHIAALQKRATGRFVCVEKNLTMIEIATLARQSYPQYPFPTWRLPNALMYVAACFDKRISFAFLRHNLDKVRVFSSQRMADVLGVTPTRIAGTCIADSCKSFLDIGVITPKN